MLTLRIEHALDDDRPGDLRLLLRDDARVLFEHQKPFAALFDESDLQRLRAYWEDYLDEPVAESRTVEKQAERRLAMLGESLFRVLFGAGEALRLWHEISPRLEEVRIEIAQAGSDRDRCPWELLRDPASGRWVALEAGGFARTDGSHFGIGDHHVPESGPPLRVLAVLASPRAGGLEIESAFRRAKLEKTPRSKVEWTILRPPTLSSLTQAASQAESAGYPFHAVHIECSAFWCDLSDRHRLPPAVKNAARPRTDKPTSGPQGYLVLSQPGGEDRLRLVDPLELADPLIEARVRLVTLTNSCRIRPSEAEGFRDAVVRGFQDVADRIASTGTLAVVQTPYRISADGAGRCWAAFYDRLAAGQPIDQAAIRARKALAASLERSPLGETRMHHDWGAVQTFESGRTALVAPAPTQETAVEAAAELRGDHAPKDPRYVPKFPAEPSSGRIPRDRQVLDLDREIGPQPVLLHGPPGFGKTQLAAEFADWCSRTGAVDGPLIYSDLREHRNLRSLLDQLASVFGDALVANGIDWAPMDEQEQLEAALLILSQIPVIWTWDSFESISDPAASAWDERDRERLLQFVELIPDTHTALLLLSRREERWFGSTITRRAMEPWSRVELQRLVASVTAASRADLTLDCCDALVEAAGGSPLTARILAWIAVEKGLNTPLGLRELVKTVREDAADRRSLPGLDAALSAAIGYVLRHMLSDPELEIAALAHLFPQVLDTQILEKMANPHRSWGLRELNTRGAFKRALSGSGDSPITRIADLGLISRIAPRQCRIEPVGAVAFQAALDLLQPAQLRPALSGRLTLFSAQPGQETPAEAPATPVAATASRKRDKAEPEQAPAPPSPHSEALRRASAAFVEAMAELGADAARAAQEGADEVVSRMNLDEAGFERAIEIAAAKDWQRPLTGLVAGLGAAYERRGRLSAWESLLRRVSVYAMDPSSHAPIRGREKLWRTVADQSVRLAVRRRTFPQALEMQRAVVRWDRSQTKDLETKPFDELTSRERALVMMLARSLNRLGEIACADSRPNHEIEEHAVELCEKLGERRTAANWAYLMGSRYTQVRSIRDLPRAERWLKRALELLPDGDAARSQYLASLGQAAWERFRNARTAERPESELIRHLTDARRYYEQAIEHADPKDYRSLAAHHLQYAHVSYSLGDIDRAVPHYRESIRHDQARGASQGAARTRFNLAIALRDTGRLGEARKYAVAAFTELRGIRGPISEGLLDRSRRLVMNIEQKLQEKRDKHARRFAAHTY